ncbi:thermonuclease family protein, partial [Baaleninema sp.]|uniref:thermonuclease family protein n=1 Tax=Baaleninema sp. TaxID=3101197 RepID=UPI003CFFA2ED
MYDGDTIRVIANGEELKIRFACIDAPEREQPRGEAARSNLKEILDRSSQIYIHRQTVDRYGRVVAEVWADIPEMDLVLVQMLQAEDGFVFPYERYAEDCSQWSAVEMAGAEARSKSLGVWSDRPPEYPWDYRQ